MRESWTPASWTLDLGIWVETAILVGVQGIGADGVRRASHGRHRLVARSGRIQGSGDRNGDADGRDRARLRAPRRHAPSPRRAFEANAASRRVSEKLGYSIVGRESLSPRGTPAAAPTAPARARAVGGLALRGRDRRRSSALPAALRVASGASASAAPSDCFELEHAARRGRRRCATRSSTASIVNAAGSSARSTSSQRSGVETGAPGRRSHRVDGRGRLPRAVLVRVDEHAAPLRLRPLGRHEPRVRARERARDDLGELARLVVTCGAARSGTSTWMPARAARLREATRARAGRASP